MRRDELLARLMTLELERDCYIREIQELRRLAGDPRRVQVTGAVLDSLGAGLKTSTEISEHARVSRKSVQTFLSELAKMGIVRSQKTTSTGRAGRPEHHYALVVRETECAL